jgi:riboflavin synthase
MLIPHTLSATTLGSRRVGDTVNIETDVLGKYVQRMLAPYLPQNSSAPPALPLPTPGGPHA